MATRYFQLFRFDFRMRSVIRRPSPALVANQPPIQAIRFLQESESPLPAPLVLAAGVAAIKGVETFPGSVLAESFSAFAKHRVRPPVLMDALIKRAKELSPDLSPHDRMAVIEGMSLLGQKIPSDFFPRPSELQADQLVDLCYFLILPGDLEPVSQKPHTELFYDSLDLLSSTLDSELSAKSRVLKIRAALRFCHRPIYEKLNQKIRQWLRKIDSHCPNTPPLVCTTPSLLPRNVLRVSEVLTKLKVAHITLGDIGPFSVPIKERDRKIWYNVSDQSGFYSADSGIQKTSEEAFRDRILSAMGWVSVPVPFWHFDRIQQKQARINYLQISRHTAIRDSKLALETVNLDPRSFDCYQAAIGLQSAVGRPPTFNETGPNRGEAYSHREKLSRSWAWKRHRPVDLPIKLVL